MEHVGRVNRDTDLTVLSSSTSGRRTRTARGRAALSTGRRKSERATAARERHASEASTSGTAVGSKDGGPSRSTNRSSENQFAMRAGPVCPASRAPAATTPNGSGVRRRRRLTKSYLVDPASSYMLVSKIKPCMSKYIPRHGETANGSLNRSLFIGSFILLG